MKSILLILAAIVIVLGATLDLFFQALREPLACADVCTSRQQGK